MVFPADIDECVVGGHLCDSVGICLNTVGGSMCDGCMAGFVGNGNAGDCSGKPDKNFHYKKLYEF